jgi:mannose-6-phosphate isomerase-like protein (cupin superfamily)
LTFTSLIGNNSTSRKTHGSLDEQDIFTRVIRRAQPKGVLFSATSILTHTARCSARFYESTRLEGQQEIYFVKSGRGTATAGGQTVDLFPNIAVLMPSNLEFTLKNIGDQPLSMYLINEPTPAGFSTKLHDAGSG